MTHAKYLSILIITILLITLTPLATGEGETNVSDIGTQEGNTSPDHIEVKPIPTPEKNETQSNSTVLLSSDANTSIGTTDPVKIQSEGSEKPTASAVVDKQKAFVGWMEMGKNATISHNYKAASEAFAAALRINKESEEARIEYAATLSQLGRDAEALEIIQQVLNKSPENTKLLIPLGRELNAGGRYDEALPVLLNATEKFPHDIEGWNELAASYAGISRYEEALTVVRKSLQISLNQSGGWEQLGSILAGQGRFYEAVAAYEKALAGDPKNTDIWTGLGDTWVSLNQLNKAAECYTTAADIRPSDTDIWTKLAQISEKLGDVSAAEEARIKGGFSNQTIEGLLHPDW